ncbi:MAG: type II CAAX endopeptidase family protein [Eubacteriales bacterium]
MMQDNEYSTVFSIKQANWCIFFVLLGYTVVDFAQALLQLFFGIKPDMDISIYARMACMLPVIIYALSSRAKVKSLRFRRTAPANIVLSIILAFFVYLFSSIFVNAIASWIVSAGGTIPNNELLDYITKGSMLVALLFLAVFAPFTEEILLRGVFQGAYMRRVGFLAVILTGVVFGLMHADLLSTINGVIAGIFLCYVYFKTRSLWCTIAFHATFNTLGYFMVPDNYVINLPWTLNFLPKETMDGSNPAYIVYTLGILVISVLMVVVFTNLIRRRNSETSAPVADPTLHQKYEMVPFILACILLSFRLLLGTLPYLNILK